MIILHGVLTFLLYSSVTRAQQFTDGSMSLGYPGLSEACAVAMNETIVNCPSFLKAVSQDNDVLVADQLNLLCSDSCYTSLTSARRNIQASCMQSTDAIVYEDIAYPATFIADHFIYTFNVSCRRDHRTGTFCDVLMANITAQPCSDCSLGQMHIQLDSPLGYDPMLAADFQSLTASCGATGFPVQSPSSYAHNASSTFTVTSTSLPTSVPTSTCAVGYTPYVTKVNDTCNSIAKAQNVSTFSLIYANGLDAFCTNMPAIGTQICLPISCITHKWGKREDCIDVTLRANITTLQLQSWNSNINAACGNLNAVIGTYVCVSPPGGFKPIPAPPPIVTTSDIGLSGTTSASGAVSAAPTPTNIAAGSNMRCGQWHTVQSGDTCYTLAARSGLSLADFGFLNPELTKDCANLQKDLAYCVQAVGTISTYSGYGTTSTPTSSISTATITSKPSSSDAKTSSSSTTGAWSTNTVTSCAKYYTVNAGDTCYGNIQSVYSISPDQFSSLNHVGCENIQAGVAYCIATSTAT